MMVAGPAIGGVAIRLWGIEAGFAIQAVAYAVGLLTLLPLRIATPPAPEVRRRPLQELNEGFDFVLSQRDIRALVFLLAVSGLLMLGPVFALVPPIVRDDLGQGALAASMLFGVMGLGMLSTSLVLATIGNFGSKGGWFIANLAIGGITVAGMGLTDSYVLLCVLMFIWGMGGGIFMNLNRTLIQSHTPDPIMGRVMSIQNLGMIGFSPLGGLAAGALAGPLGAAGCLVVLGVALTAVSTLVFVLQPSLRQMS
jgi:MFS family permease